MTEGAEELFEAWNRRYPCWRLELESQQALVEAAQGRQWSEGNDLFSDRFWVHPLTRDAILARRGAGLAAYDDVSATSLLQIRASRQAGRRQRGRL